MLKSSLPAALSALLLSLVLLFTVSQSRAQQETRSFYNVLQQRLIADGFDPERIRQLYQAEKVGFEARGVTAYFQHNEATLDYDKLTTESYIRLAREYMGRQAETLALAEKNFGVDRRVITAIILVETKFGVFTGTRSIINTLSTMASLTETRPREYIWEQLPADRRVSRAEYDRKADQKSAWAYKELKAFLTYTETHGIDAPSVLGSYAGALGLAQFMPSNILALGVDGDGDGRIDLFQDADAIFSIANYLRNYGWKPGLSREQAYKAVFSYNRSKYYVNAILKIVDLLGEAQPQTEPRVPAAPPQPQAPQATAGSPPPAGPQPSGGLQPGGPGQFSEAGQPLGVTKPSGETQP